MPKNRTRKKVVPQAVSVLGYEDTAERGIFTRRIARNLIDVEKLGNEVAAFMEAMEEIIGKLSEEVGRYQMETIAITAEVSAKGQVSLLGTGGEVAGKGGLTFTFKRASAKEIA